MPWTDWVMVPVWALSGSVIYTAALVTFSSFAFKFVGPYSYTLMIPHTLLQASRYPLSIYPAWVHFILLFLVPYGVFNFLPGSWVMGKMDSPLLALGGAGGGGPLRGRGPGGLGKGLAPVPKHRIINIGQYIKKRPGTCIFRMFRALFRRSLTHMPVLQIPEGGSNPFPFYLIDGKGSF